MKIRRYYPFLFCLRITLCICMITAVLLFILSYYVQNSFNKYITQQSLYELHALTKILQNEILRYPPTTKAAIRMFKQNIRPIINSYHSLYLTIENSNNTLIYSNAQSNPLFTKFLSQWISSGSTANRLSVPYPQQAYLSLTTSFILPDGNQYRIRVGIPPLKRADFLAKERRAGFIFIIMISTISFLWTFVAIYFTQKPIQKLAIILRNLTLQQLNYRIPLSKVSPKAVGVAQAFNQMLAHIEDAFKRQRNFTTDIAHEIRTPITNLVTQTQIALIHPRTSDQYKEILYSHLEEYERLAKMISDMLFLAQADNRLLTPEWVKIDLINIFIHLFEYYEPLAKDKNIQFWLQGFVPSIRGDRLMITRAIDNLLSNAIRYTPQKQQILVKLEQYNENYIQFTIANPGKKIDPVHLPKLFDRFYRVDRSQQRNGGGSGIGLAIVKAIIETFEGSIRVESDDHSTRFIVILPI